MRAPRDAAVDRPIITDGGAELPATVDAPVGNDGGGSGGLAGTGGSTGTGGGAGTAGEVGTGGSGGLSGTGGGDPDAGGPDGGSDAVVAACNPNGAFGPVMPLTAFNTTASDDAIFFTSDGLTAYLSSTRPGGMGGFDIWYATRVSTDQDFGAPRLLEGVNTAEHERTPRPSNDGLQLFFTWGTPAGAPGEIRVASRASTASAFTTSAPVAGINSAATEASLWLSADERLAYFFSNRPGGLGLADLYVGDLGPAGISNVRPIPGLNTLDNDFSPVLTGDSLTMYFSSDRVVPGFKGGSDIWITRRARATDNFGPPEILPELNSPESDGVTWVSRDGCTVIIQSLREMGIAGRFGYDLYQATRAR